MSGDPSRWRDDPSAPDGARELLAHARRTPAPDPQALALSAATLLALAAKPASAAAAVLSKLASTPSAIAGLPLAGKLALGVTAVAVVAAVGTQVGSRHERAHARAAAHVPERASRLPRAASQATNNDPVTPDRATASAAPAGEPDPAPDVAATAVPADRAGSASAGAAVHATRAHGAKLRHHASERAREAVVNEAPAASEPEDPLALEVRWLDQARSLLASDPAAALARADQHAQRFGAPALSAERELIAIDALQRLGRPQQARARADALLRRHPSSLYRERLQRLLRAPAR